MKSATYIGIAAAILLIICCFIPWAYYPDLQENFTGFYSKQNNYGRPGKTIIFLSVLALLLFAVPRLWAKRVNQFIGVLLIAYAMKNYFIFSACYLGICPQVKPGLIGVLLFSLIILISALLSRAPVKAES